jgi:FixJ family two-component response regulator/putative methionine-R-sulfoxide reductase with GAF domain
MKLPYTWSSSIGIPIWAVGAGDPISVLLIDDDEDELTLTRALLAKVKDVQYTVDWSGTYRDGLASIARNEHDAYLIDHQLGGQTGIELVREARRAGSLAALIMLTGQRDRATDMAAMDAGATDFLMKGKTDAALLDRTLRYSISQVAVVSALDRSRSQMAGLEELGRILVADGPTPAAIERAVDVIVERFALSQIAIYLVDGDTLYLAGQHGHQNPLSSVSRADASVERVARARQPLFIPSLSPAPASGASGASAGQIATELSVPLLVGGELIGLLNVSSPTASPIGEQDYAAIRLVADRITVALEVARERKLTDERLSTARKQLLRGDERGGQDGVLDGETQTYRRAMLEPLVEVAIATSGSMPDRCVGLLLVACATTGGDAANRLAAEVRSLFGTRPTVRFAETELAVLLVGLDELAARAEASELMARAHAADLGVWCSYAALGRGWGAVDLISAARTSLAFAERVGAGTVIG